VIQEILAVLPWTLELTVVSMIIGIIIGVPLGVWAAINRNRMPDYVTRIASLLGLSFPPFVSAIILLDPVRDHAALVPGDQRGLRLGITPGSRRWRCPRSTSA
jgi:ABC-type dipeptide/oligopeptide/nickel transport system permease component